MKLQVIKRNGSLEEFNSTKIYNAIMKAGCAVGLESLDDFSIDAETMAKDVADLVLDLGTSEIPLETIQDLIEIELCDYPAVAKEFILYREKHRQEREKALKYKKIIKDRAINPEESDAKQNANVDECSFSGRMYEASEALWKETALEDFMSKEAAVLHKDGKLYYHDLSRYAIGQHNCLQLSLSYIFEHGLKTRQSHLRPPSRFASACQQIAVIMQIISQCQYGGISEPHLDRTLKPFLQKSRDRIDRKFPYLSKEDKEKMLNDEIEQGAEALVANLSSLQSRSGSQLPFSSINYGADSDPDAIRIACAITNAMIDGVGPNHITPPFPILCYQVKKGVNRYPTDPGYKSFKLAIKCMTMRLTPQIVNLDSSVAHSDENNPDTWLTAMGCRTQLGKDRFDKENPYNRVGRGNLSPHTIVPVSLGIKYGICQGLRQKPDLDNFRKEFDYLLNKAEESLICRAHLIFNQKMSSAYEMYVNHVWAGDYEYDPNATVYEVLKHGTLAIGIVGWAETLVALFGENHYKNDAAREFLKEMTIKLNTFCAEASERNNLNFAAYATPAEGLSRTAMVKLQELYGDKIKGVTDHKYVTNSYHIPVTQEIDVFEKIKIEAEFAKYYTGGNICYVEFDSTAIHNLDAIEEVINYALDNDIPYFAINFPLDYCNNCGFSGEIPEEICPQCHEGKIIRLRRVTGYISAGDYRDSMNVGKQAEVEDRVKHTKGVQVQL